ncbi:MAG: acyltransferase family protein [Micromonosporaceae bacterium]
MRSRLPSLTGARFIGACMVFLYHTIGLFPFASPHVQRVARTLVATGGYARVTFFFVLSGFVLTWAARPGDTAPATWRRRFLKVYPNHLLTLLAAVILLTGVGKAAIQGRDLVLNLLLVQSWHPDLFVRNNFNAVAWTLSCEALFYVCFPFLLKLINQIRPERLWFWTTLSAASVIALPSLVKLVPGGQRYNGMSFREFWLVFNFPPTQMLSFIFGIFMAKIVLTGQQLPLRVGGAFAVTLFAHFGLTPVVPPLYRISAVTVIPIGLLIAAAATVDVDRQSTFLGSKPMVWLGNISFAFFVWHYLVLTYGHRWLGAGENWSTPTALAVMILLFAVSLALAWATYTFLEQPVMKRFANPRRQRDPAVVTTGPTDNHTEARQ